MVDQREFDGLSVALGFVGAGLSVLLLMIGLIAFALGEAEERRLRRCREADILPPRGHSRPESIDQRLA
ncbi:hypothetical protein [Actinokineospora sp.]|uniref:hypothetical protein n=1 Tax=Actinokineospora sp. TaxID=1872133 RepID=UPI003D6A5928